MVAEVRIENDFMGRCAGRRDVWRSVDGLWRCLRLADIGIVGVGGNRIDGFVRYVRVCGVIAIVN